MPELHERVVRQILSGVRAARRDELSPMGVVVEGRAGSGKTHLLGAVRETIQRDGGYFFLVQAISSRTFWENVVGGVFNGLQRDAIGWGTQLRTFLARVTAQLGLPVEVRDAVAARAPLTREHLDHFVRALRDHAGTEAQDYQDTARALVLLGSTDYALQDIGQAHMYSVVGEAGDRAAWGLSQLARGPQEIVQDVSRLLALTGAPTVMAVDQIDTLISQSRTAAFDRGTGDDVAATVTPIADGLLALRETTRRTLTVLSVLPEVLVLLKRYAPIPVLERFREVQLEDRIPTPEIGLELIAKRFRARFAEERFAARYDTWPILPEAFADAVEYSPRGLLRRVDRHVAHCLATDTVVELTRLSEESPEQPEQVPERPKEGLAAHFEALDRRFGELVAEADVRAALDHRSEDSEMPALLAAGLSVWIQEQAPSGTTYKTDPLPSAKPALHGRLVEVLDEATENEAHCAFRAVASPMAVAVISRVKAACTMSGIDVNIPQRRLVLLRNEPWPKGPRTTEIIEAFRAAGGIEKTIDEADLKVFAALRDLCAKPMSGLAEWLVERRHASRTRLLSDVLGEGSPEPRELDDPDPTTIDEQPTDGSSIGLGRAIDGDAPFQVNLESLRRHTVIFAGSGSGKTVLIRRLVEECARQGVSSIVLDPNNDLARLGDAWPEAPDGWGAGDAARARDYLDNTEVVVWTPRVSAGRPLTFQPLPDFGPLLNDPDEFDAAIDAAVAALAPRARVDGSAKAQVQGRAVVKEALLWYARRGHTGLRGFADLLSDLPEELTSFAKGTKLAHDAGETLKAAMMNDPLFGGTGTAVDPGVLLTPRPGRRARVSVISFVGLSSDEQRQSFVNQLQMALFAWIKRNPAGDRPLGGLFVMDEAQTLAPSSGSTPCTASSIALASQARKYGLGLVFATQAPKGLHNQISGNATTQFFGLLNAPAQIDAAKELAATKNGRVPDIGILRSGQFYAAGEGFSFVKVRTPLCLTHHPKSPLSPEEVIDRTRR
ncbi:helicase HerA domain-containing protein [Luedemannella flava]